MTETDTSNTKEPKQQSYQDKVEKMSNPQLHGELRRKMRVQEKPRINDVWANVLAIVLTNHDKGMRGYIG